MGAFASYAPMALSALQTGQQISSNRADQKSRAAQTEANRQADIASINASETNVRANVPRNCASGRHGYAPGRARRAASKRVADRSNELVITTSFEELYEHGM